MAGIIFSIVISVLLVIAGFIISDCECKVGMLSATMVFFGTFMFVAAAIELSNQNKPTAIDVYRNRTTLKITYVDSVATDSVVVFKEQIK